MNAAGFLIHGEIHKVRDDVQAVCHTHSPHGMAWSAFARPLEMLTQDIAYVYGDAQAVYEVRVEAFYTTGQTLTPIGLWRNGAYYGRGGPCSKSIG